MSNNSWNNFGVLKSVSKDDRFVWVSNEEGRQLKMSIATYQESAEQVYSKAQALVGKNVKIRSSQNSTDLKHLVWFNSIDNGPYLSSTH
ncbi:conserved hypothetical protein [Vibrio nigripulchritudo MADA3029]|uniref:Uncharacterized protein n=2 Tax=Vibrio nigripulchritudo TaxID=28173 RepID=U4KCS4_9VIBR|nr:MULTISPECIES: hypothetical protein [Vibrio]EGU56229.1 hypothetical protein VINI7043_16428 [Vibrio nigripulchritudo ATCC 27043]UAB72223.1 hypothetical protein INR79_23460 [Vibrio sp. SCSIO 43132]CCN50033.1 conserved hypothetical protein [Vibrio nigripulchritudo MADA3020]CCN56129.1 conserved hypothetical protein [Vibrio nigripulchritudo MADA3021]CCN59037.1 conserved hypothetical protein [Vibrio nigripulchritudo MADA3029]